MNSALCYKVHTLLRKQNPKWPKHSLVFVLSYFQISNLEKKTVLSHAHILWVLGDIGKGTPTGCPSLPMSSITLAFSILFSITLRSFCSRYVMWPAVQFQDEVVGFHCQMVWRILCQPIPVELWTWTFSVQSDLYVLSNQWCMVTYNHW